MAPRTVRVKGFPDPIRAVRVVPDTGLAPPRRRRAVAVSGRRVALLLAGVTGAAIGIAALVAVGMNWPDAGSSSPSPSASGIGVPTAAAPFDGPGLAFLDPETGEPVGERIPLGNAVEVQYADGAFWVLAFNPPALHRVDSVSREVGGSIPIAFTPGSWIVDGTTIWFTDYELPLIHKLDATSGRQIEELELDIEPTGLQGIALGAGSLWVAVRDAEEGLLRVDPATGEIQHRYQMFAESVVATDDVVWATAWFTGEIHRIDPRTDEVTDEVMVAAPISNLLLAEGYLWATNPENGELFEINDQASVIRTFSTPGVWYVSAADGHVWAAGEEERRIDRIEVLTGEQTTYDVDRSVNAVAEGDGVLALAMPRQMADVLVGVTGNLLNIGTPFGPFEYTDPAIAGAFGNGLRDRMEAATCAKTP